MQLHRIAAIVFTGLVLTAGCKKNDDVEINSCMNGQLDSGETAIDCGGNCGNCPDAEFPAAGFRIYGSTMPAETKQLTYTSGWKLHLNNDSVSVTVNLGNNGSVGTYNMSPADCSLTYNGISYPTLADGTYSISQHNTSTHKMSGFFDANFLSPTFPGDTLHVTNGFFEFLPY